MGLMFAQLLPCYTQATCAGAGRRKDRVSSPVTSGLPHR